MKLLSLVWLATLTFASVPWVACQRRSTERLATSEVRPPDFILVVVDALRRDHLGMYGYDKPTSPAMDSIASQGIVFDNAYSHGSQTFNSTASLLTSRYFPYLLPRSSSSPITDLNSQTAAKHSRVPVLAESNVTLAEALREGGYQTAGIFTNPHHHSSSGFWQGFDYGRYLAPEKGDLAYARGPKIRHAFFDWYDGVREARPYFAYLHFMDVHNPYRPPRFLRKQFVTVKGRDLYTKGVPEEDRQPTENDLRYMIALYDAEIRFVDLVVESLVEGLRQRKALDQTVLIITSDHGDEFLDHGGFGHGSHLERELIHIPLLISGLHSVPRRETALTRHLDVAPTIVELAGLSSPVEFEGESLVTSIVDPEQEISAAKDSFAAVSHLRSLTTQEWHFTSDPRADRTRLYHLETDPAGQRDLTARHPEVVEEFLQRLSWLEELKARTAARSLELAREHPLPDREPFDAAIHEQLEALGYIDP